MFAFAIWNERTQELFLARDRVGKKPLLYAEVNGQLIFGSEFSALLLHPDISRDIQPEALDYYLSFMCIPAPLTAYVRFESSSPVTGCAGATARSKYSVTGNLTSRRNSTSDEEEAGERTVEILREAVTRAFDVGSSAGRVSFRRHRFERGRRVDEPGVERARQNFFDRF